MLFSNDRCFVRCYYCGCNVYYGGLIWLVGICYHAHIPRRMLWIWTLVLDFLLRVDKSNYFFSKNFLRLSILLLGSTSPGPKHLTLLGQSSSINRFHCINPGLIQCVRVDHSVCRRLVERLRTQRSDVPCSSSKGQGARGQAGLRLGRGTIDTFYFAASISQAIW